VSKRRRAAPDAEAGPAAAGEGGAGVRQGGGMGLPAQLGLLTAVFAVSVGIAELAGAANLGVSFGIGQVVFAVVLLVLLIRA
jgi:hypothetical protein